MSSFYQRNLEHFCIMFGVDEIEVEEFFDDQEIYEDDDKEAIMDSAENFAPCDFSDALESAMDSLGFSLL